MKPFDKHKWLLMSLRRASYRYPPRNEAKKEARVERGKYLCAGCLEIKRASDIQMDHIVPVASDQGFIDWNDHIDRLFCSQEGFQCLCSSCHQEKTNKESEARRQAKKNNKES